MDGSCTIIWTVISGVLVFVLSQLFIEYYLKPIQDYKALKAKIAYTLVYYACYYCNPQSSDDKNGMQKESSNELRKLASETMAFAQIRPKFNLSIPSKDDLLDVKSLLILLSNSCFSDGKALENHSTQKKIFNTLNIEKYSQDKE